MKSQHLDAILAAQETKEPVVLVTEIESGEPAPDGTDTVRFVAAINPGAPAGPIDRIASGVTASAS